MLIKAHAVKNFMVIRNTGSERCLSTKSQNSICTLFVSPQITNCIYFCVSNVWGFFFFLFLTENSDYANLSRSTSVATGLNTMKRQKVKTIFPHTAGNNKTLLSFAQGDIITLLVAEEKDGWLYGEHDTTRL